MFEWFINQSELVKAILASCFTFGLTSLGASVVFLFKKIKDSILDSMLGLSAGIMIAASFWSLISPALSLVEHLNIIGLLIVCFGLIFGGLFLIIGDKIYNSYSKEKKSKRIFMLVLSITLHNIPEGLAIGIAFGSLKYCIGSTLASAVALAIGIGIQNFPEGSAVSLPLRRDGYSRLKSFIIGSLTGIVEPLAAIIGVIMITSMKKILPFSLSFAAGTMIYVVVNELIPESHKNNNSNLVSMSFLIGFIIMMFLDVFLG